MDTKQKLQQLLKTALISLNLPLEEQAPLPQIERARDSKHGDFACNIAMMLAKKAKIPPRELATQLIAAIPKTAWLEKVAIAGPGFINFTVASSTQWQVLQHIVEHAEQFGCSTIGNEQSIHIEYVSANPTGPLHVGHGRGAAYGASVANVLKAAGYKVHREYYVNDAGRQMQILALSAWIRYLQQHNIAIELPPNAYQGDYIIDIAKELTEKYHDQFITDPTHYQDSIPSHDGEDIEKSIDAKIQACIQCIGEEAFSNIRQHTLMHILADIKNDLSEFGVNYDEWFFESQLHREHMIKAGLDLLKKQGYLYEKNGAQWFQATALGDEKDRVLIRDNGKPTYFAADVAYHLYKYNQGYDHIIDVFGADHHGYIARINCFLKGLNKDPSKLAILLVQFAILYRGKEKVSMSTRSGSFVTLRELRSEVGNDAARFFYVMRKPEQHLDFDLELAKSESNDNPVYSIQYAHARICSVARQMQEQGLSNDTEQGLQHLSLLSLGHELDLCKLLSRYPETIELAAAKHQPHLLAYYLQELAQQFHGYYNAAKFIVEDAALRNARVVLINATKQVIYNGLKLLGVSAPEKM